MSHARKLLFCLPALAGLVLAGCQSAGQTGGASPSAPAPKAATAVLRVKAGSDKPWTDSEGNVWQADKGFDGGDTVSRDASLAVGNTTDPELYRSEHYGMTSFTAPLPNGNYLVKLHFAETFEGMTGPGQRVFSVNVQGQDFKDLDLFAKAGFAKAYVLSVPVTVSDGTLKITFTPNVENPEINGIEVFTN